MPDVRTKRIASLRCSLRPFRLFGMNTQHLSYLFYLVFWFIDPLQEPSTLRWVYLVLAMVAFMPLYAVQHCSNSPTRRWYATGGMLLLALLYVPINVSAFGIYIFIASVLPELVEETKLLYGLLLAECAIILLQAWLFHLSLWEWTIACPITLLTGTNLWYFHTQRKANARLQMAQDEIEQLAKTAERERIARDLHDVLGHTLSLIAIKSELAGRLLDTDPERTAQELAEIQTTARRALAEVRQTVSGYRAQGLEAEIQQAAGALAAAGVTLASRPECVPRLPAQQEASLALVLREAVTNIVRHSGARSCAIAMTSKAGGTLLDISDDGRGCSGREGNGLRGMRERIRELEGTLEVRAGNGTAVHIYVPSVSAAHFAVGKAPAAMNVAEVS